mgnify:FL=1|tara:strand:+ start:806 stop:1282 length:477 start_codon:yes stop_codon:yes gene_type:complete
MKKNFSLIITLFSIFFSINRLNATNLIDKGYYVVDLKQKVDWLKCSAGQQWDDTNCSGEAIKLNLEEAEIALNQLNEQLEGEWRLPTKKELKSLVCSDCTGAKINKKYFPNTPAEPFWTSQRNWWSPKFYWSVNFFTGHVYGRFVPEKRLFLRFLRDR